MVRLRRGGDNRERHARGKHQHPEQQRATAIARRQPRPDQRRAEKRQCRRREHRARRQRRHAKPELQQQRQRKEKRTDRREKEKHGADPRHERPVGKQPHIQHGHATAAHQPLLIVNEIPQHQQRQHRPDQRPPRPAVLAPLHHRHQDQGQPGGAEQRAPHIHLRRNRRAPLGQGSPPRQQRRDTHRHIDQEHQPPPQAERIHRDQHAAQQLRHRRRHPLDRAHHPERAPARLALEQHPDRRQHLRHQHARAHALQGARGNKLPRRHRQPA
ncbi:Uncharacterised protein [Bordetella pertussis]|nr:Uncharacterised protein [Bordetella pertussis]CFP52346.1 Uncharacterised protein [Bordetella pertussis]CPI64009.1 Uncharacterised protein [Bordetella pertussis]CPJ68967.1 Uncharacterised protein [Bordetella pertussis]CPK78870.1 Uncharacterised protein [Bordetella pertussis]